MDGSLHDVVVSEYGANSSSWCRDRRFSVTNRRRYDHQYFNLLLGRPEGTKVEMNARISNHLLLPKIDTGCGHSESFLKESHCYNSQHTLQ